MDNKIKLEYLSKSMESVLVQNRENVILTMCENEDSEDSKDFATHGSVDYGAIRNGEIERYCALDSNDPLRPTGSNSPPATIQAPLNCQFFLIGEIAQKAENSQPVAMTGANRPCQIKPNIGASTNSTSSGTKRSFITEPGKKRDDKRRATHNEVERRRRDKINSWIFKLKELIPESSTDTSCLDSKIKTSTGDSKSQILIKACEYIQNMQDEVESLKKCLVDNENLRQTNRNLQNENKRLRLRVNALTNSTAEENQTPDAGLDEDVQDDHVDCFEKCIITDTSNTQYG